jgi:PTH1 family peptidyl-tRNA hydrolase
MNNSGDAVCSLLKKFKGDVCDLVVVFDDVDLPLGDVRLRQKGSAGTHNGMRDIIAKIKSQDFVRIRIGIGKPEEIPLANFVLMKIRKEDSEKINNAIDEATNALIEIINDRNSEC